MRSALVGLSLVLLGLGCAPVKHDAETEPTRWPFGKSSSASVSSDAHLRIGDGAGAIELWSEAPPSGPGRATLAREHAEFEAPDRVERFVRTTDGIEQSWRFARASAGDLVVTVHVEGADSIVSDARGAVIRSGPARYRYSDATWIDARGHRSPVEMQVEQGAISLRVPASTVDASVFPGVLDPILSPAIEPSPLGRFVGRSLPRVTSDGTQFFVGWIGDSFPRVRGTSVQASGDPGADGNWDIGPPPDASDNAIAFDGTEFAVAWIDPNGVAQVRTDRIMQPLVLGSNASGPLHLSCQPGVCVATWSGGASRFERYGYVSSLALPPASGTRSDFNVAASSTQFLIAWSEAGAIRFARYASDGSLLDAVSRVLATGSASVSRPSIASDGQSFALTWVDGAAVFAARVTADGSVAGSPVAIPGDPSVAPQIAFAGQEYFAITGGPTVYAMPQDFTGPPTEFATWPNTNTAAISCIATVCLPVFWHQDGDVIRAARFSSDGTVIDPQPFDVLHTEARRAFPAVTATKNAFVLSWVDERSPGLFAQFLEPDAGLPLGPEIPIEGAANAGSVPHLAANDEQIAVMWSDQATGYLFVRRLSAIDGGYLDSAPIQLPGSALSQNESRFDVAGFGGGFLTAWTGPCGSVYAASGLCAARIAHDGTLIDPQGLSLPNSGTYGVAIGVLGSQALVASVTFGVRVDLDAGVLDSSERVYSNTPYDFEAPPAVATNGDGYLLLYNAYDGADAGGLWADHIGLDGLSQGRELLVPAVEVETDYRPQVSFDGNDFVVAWVTNWRAPVYDGMVNVGRYDLDGGVLDPWMALSDANIQKFDALNTASLPTGTTLIPYHGGTSDLAFRLFRNKSLGVHCGEKAECNSGACVDGVCCDSACGGGDPGDCMACSIAAGAASDGHCGPRPGGTVCRPSAGACVLAATCDGTSALCPNNPVKGDGQPCDDGNACTTGTLCVSGVCTQGQAVLCPGEPCGGYCDPASGCHLEEKPEGTPCDDGDRCTEGTTCSGGVCGGGTQICAIGNRCQTLDCDPIRGCTVHDVADGLLCNDGDSCTSNDQCHAGRCVGVSIPGCTQRLPPPPAPRTSL